eukprot:m.118235 g.118235  ORF g.118235 m.118235 type:complete len:533 (+) comp13650_c1_seq1:129-1727(+)
MDTATINAAAAAHPSKGVTFKYGTAGFRTRADTLDPVMLRVGMLAALRSQCKAGAAIGVMVTASHNPEGDNGAKIVDPMGEMLEASWEGFATELANTPDDKLAEVFSRIASDLGVDTSASAKVVFGMDTRESSPALTKAAMDGAALLGAQVIDMGVVTTPQTHHAVRSINDPDYGTPTVDGYHAKLSTAFKDIYRLTGATDVITLKVDCANGVGAPQFRKTLAALGGIVQAEIVNAGEGKLNHECGADYVKVQQGPPANMKIEDGDRCVTFDGDADRVMYFFNKDGSFFLLDGDRISALAANCLQQLLDKAGIKLNIGVVQTAYANGNSTSYLEHQAKVPVACTKTGVKHLHHKALDYDVGIYFEANGHGTVIFNDAAIKTIKAAAEAGNESAKILEAFSRLINQTVGDAISDMLMVEAILLVTNSTVLQWAELYSDLPNRQLKVKIQDRSVVQTANAERECTAPEGLQAAIDALVAKVENGRSFVRPSGTEDVVRVYAEAATREACDKLAWQVAGLVWDRAAGIGDRPAQA